MNHIGIDLGSRESQVCIRTATGEIVREARVGTSSLKAMFQEMPKGRVILETSCESMTIADSAIEAGHEVRVVPATLVRALGVGARGMKNDVRDARVTSEVSCRIDLPSVHIPSPVARERKATCTFREALVKSRTMLVNTARAWLRSKLVSMRKGYPEAFPQRVRKALLMRPEGIPAYVEQLLKAIETLNEQIALADKDLLELAKHDSTCKRLMTMPGVGPATAIRFVAAIDDVARFKDANKLESYLGLTPGENTTGFRERRTRMTKAGPARVRHVLGQAALTLARCRPQDPNVQWAKNVSERVGKQKATMALARKMARILFAMWRDEATYAPKTLDSTKKDKPLPSAKRPARRRMSRRSQLETV
jgi:transposase